MTEINASQLAWLLDIRVIDARRKMIHAYVKHSGEAERYSSAVHNFQIKFGDSFPKAMDVDMLAEFAGIPGLRAAIEDVQKNYMKRGPTRGYILNYPHRKVQEAKDHKRLTGNEPNKVKLYVPEPLASFLSDEDKREILQTWNNRYGEYNFVQIQKL